MGRPPKSRSPARARILETADRLFGAEGVRAVGIDRIISEAGVAKRTLYGHFRSKEALVLEVLARREEALLGDLARWERSHAARGADPLDAFFGALGDWFASPSFRGCFFVNTAMETADPRAEAARFAAAHKARRRRALAERLAKVGGRAGRGLAPAVHLLVEGAMQSAAVEGRRDAAEEAWRAARRLIEAAEGGRDRREGPAAEGRPAPRIGASRSRGDPQAGDSGGGGTGPGGALRRR